MYLGVLGLFSISSMHHEKNHPFQLPSACSNSSRASQSLSPCLTISRFSLTTLWHSWRFNYGLYAYHHESVWIGPQSVDINVLVDISLTNLRRHISSTPFLGYLLVFLQPNDVHWLHIQVIVHCIVYHSFRIACHTKGNSDFLCPWWCTQSLLANSGQSCEYITTTWLPTYPMHVGIFSSLTIW